MKQEQYQPLYVVEGSGVNINQAFQLRESSAGIYNISSFVDDWNSSPNPDAFAIGMSWVHFFHATKALEIPNYFEAYRKILGPKAPPNTEKFMQTIHDEQHPIVFFVPSNVLHPEVQKSITSEEFIWCLNHRNQISTIKFVFGLYNLPPTEVEEFIDKRKKDTLRKTTLSRLLTS